MSRLASAALLMVSLAARANTPGEHVGGGRCECWQPNDIYCEMPPGCTEICLHTNYTGPNDTLEPDRSKWCDVNREHHKPVCKPNYCYKPQKPGAATQPPPAKTDGHDEDAAARKKLASLFVAGARPLPPKSPLDKNRARVKKLSEAYKLGGGEKNHLRPFEETLPDAYIACLQRAKACRYTCSVQEDKCWDARCKTPYDEAMRRARTDWARNMAGLRLDLCVADCGTARCSEACECARPRSRAKAEGKTSAQ